MNALILSAALDTNGQNARYVKASEKWGTADGVLKALALGKYDPASVVGRYQAAAEKSDALRIRSAHHSTHIYQQMPADIFWDRRTEPLVKQLATDADVIHLNNSWRPWQRLRLKIRKPMLLHHHGSLFRSDPKGMLALAQQRGWTQCVSTVDLTRMAPERLHWAPTAYDVDWLQDFGTRHREAHNGIRVVSAPTNREFKATAALEAAVRKLQADGLDVELVLVEGKPWRDCMAIKATADIYFDQVGLGYGCNAVESWGMGIPVIAGADEWTLNRMTALWGALPFYTATEGTIGDAIAALATSKQRRTQYAARGLKHVRRYHDELPALTRLAQLYRMTIDQVPYAIDSPIPPARFTANVGQLHIGSRYINFPAEVDNPHMATKIRVYALRFPKYGIVEEVGA